MAFSRSENNWVATNPTVSGLIIALRGEVGKRIGGRGHVLE
jgi:hypothetical protein